MDVIEYFERRKQDCEESLRYVARQGFQLWEFTADGQVDITERHKQSLRDQCEEYRRMLGYLKSEP